MPSKVEKMMAAQSAPQRRNPRPSRPKTETETEAATEANPQPVTEAATDTHTTMGDDLDTSHLEALEAEIVAEERSGDDAEGVTATGERAAAGLITRDDFFAMFQVCFHVPNVMPFPPFPLESLPLKPDEMQPARSASDAIYEIAAETAYLRWLVEPGSIWMQRALAIGPFVAVKAMAIRAELAARSDPPRSIMEPAPVVADPDAPPAEKSNASTVIQLKAP